MSLELLIKVLGHELSLLEGGEVRCLNAEDETQRYKWEAGFASGCIGLKSS